MKLSSSSVTAVAFCLLGAVTASPLVSRGTCLPNFEGNDLKVINSALPTWPAPANYRVEFSGQWPDSYLIKLANNHDLVVAANAQTAGSDLNLVGINFSSSDPLQIWNLRCDVCGSPSSGGQFTTGCAISLRAADTLCVSLDTTAQTVSLQTCNNSPNQKWNFQKA